MRYASILTTNKIEESIPANTSLIRYLFVQDELYALVADDKQKQLFSLGNIDLNPSIAYLAHYASQETKSMEILHTLYQQLWKPFAKNIKHKKIIIIPDGILYNLNFELLTSEKLNYFRELSKKSLLSEYTISYNYSLNLLNAKNNTTTFKNNFVAFAPGFSDKIKIDYQDVVKDTMLFDKGYLSLLPQPFSIGLATRIGDMLGGNYFIHENSTKESFRENAGSNRIIHIGTHAESNNEHPEFSKLIFAKNMITK